MPLIRWLRQCFCAVFVLASLIALTEVGLRISRLRAAELQSPEPVSQAAAEWRLPSSLTGWELPRQSRISTDGELGPVAWRTNSWGMRGPEPVVPKPAGTYRVLCLGDETLLGPALPDDAILAQQLSQRLNVRTRSPVEVLTATVPSGCPQSFMLAYERVFSPLQPDVVVLQLSQESLLAGKQQRRWMKRNSQGMVLACLNPRADREESSSMLSRVRSEFAVVDWCFEKLNASTALPTTVNEPPVTGQPLGNEDIQRSLNAVLRLQQVCQAAGTRLVVCFSPSHRTESTPADHRQLVELAVPWLSAQQIPAIDAIAWLSPEMVEVDGGWTSAGHQRVAEFLATQFQANLAGPWSAPYAAPAILPASHYETPVRQGVPEISRAPR